VALAGGAGVIAFSVAGGIIAFHDKMKQAFQIEQSYMRIDITGKSVSEDDIGHYLPDITVNGDPVPAARHGNFIEMYVPYVLDEPKSFEMRARLHRVEQLPSLVE
jgi:hypothetical protein